MRTFPVEIIKPSNEKVPFTRPTTSSSGRSVAAQPQPTQAPIETNGETILIDPTPTDDYTPGD